MLPEALVRVRRTSCTSGLSLDFAEMSGFCFTAFCNLDGWHIASLDEHSGQQKHLWPPLSGDTTGW